MALRLLVVDDDPDVRDIMEFCLTDLGYIVDVAEAPGEALEKLCSQKYDLLVTDLSMPDGGGRVLIESAKRARPELKILVVSGFEQCDDHEFLRKPVQLSDLRNKIEQLTGRSNPDCQTPRSEQSP